MRRVLLLGATGETGRRTAQAMLQRGIPPVLVGRDRGRVSALARDLGGLEYAVADASDSRKMAELIAPEDVVLSTVGPFFRVGRPALDAAVEAGAAYLDSTGEPTFVRHVFEVAGPRAEETGATLLPAFGYDFVPGNVAGALALEAAGKAARRVDIGYFLTGSLRAAAGPAALESLARSLTEPMYSWRRGIVTEPGGLRLRRFNTPRRRPALSIGGSEHFALSRYAELDEVNVYLGWFGPATAALHHSARATATLSRAPRLSAALQRATLAALRLSTRRVDDDSLQTTGSHIVATAHGSDGRELAQVHLSGGHHLPLTAHLLAWGACELAARSEAPVGALGPVEAFGVDRLREVCAESGLLARTHLSHPPAR